LFYINIFKDNRGQTNQNPLSVKGENIYFARWDSTYLRKSVKIYYGLRLKVVVFKKSITKYSQKAKIRR
jgi:hypothetical protein